MSEFEEQPRLRDKAHSNAVPFSRCDAFEVELVRTGSCWVVAPAAGAGCDGPSVDMIAVKKTESAKVGSGLCPSIQPLVLVVDGQVIVFIAGRRRCSGAKTGPKT